MRSWPGDRLGWGVALMIGAIASVGMAGERVAGEEGFGEIVHEGANVQEGAGVLSNCTKGGGEADRVIGIGADGTLLLASGRVVRLGGIDLPKWPLSGAAKPGWRAGRTYRHLSERVAGRAVRLWFGRRRRDRHGRLLAQVATMDDGAGVRAWLQGALVAAGMARVRIDPDHLACAAQLLRLERIARKRRLGYWKDMWYRVYRAGDPELVARSGDFVVVEGRVLAVGRGREWTYLNFGRRWKTDFTIMIANGNLRRFEKSPKAPEMLRGRRVRVRGTLKSMNGPAIDVAHPEMIEIVE